MPKDLYTYKTGAPVIMHNGQMGWASARLALQAGRPHYRVTLKGRPSIPTRAAGDASTLDNVPESSIRGLGMTPGELDSADQHMLDNGIRPLSTEQRVTLGGSMERIRDDDASTDHEVSEAKRYLAALTIVDAE